MRTVGPDRRLWAGVAALTLLALLAVAADVVTPYDPTAPDLAGNLAGPSASHPMGQDKLGRDVLSRVVHGARTSLTVGVVTVGISVLLGAAIGALAGWVGGWTDDVLMRMVDAILAFPGLLLAIGLTSVLGPSLRNVVFALCLIGWTGYARLVRGEVRRLRTRPYVEAAQALGTPGPRILARHVLPGVVGPLIVQGSFGMAGAIVAEASLSFLGLGVQPPAPSWGSMLNDGRAFVLVAPHVTLFPGLAIMTTVLVLNLLGDALRDRLAPRAPVDLWR